MFNLIKHPAFLFEIVVKTNSQHLTRLN